MTLENFEFTINGSPLVLIALIIIAVVYSYYTYLYTIPATTTLVKSFLLFLRSTALILLLVILFEPLITVNYLKKIEPINLLFVDNSTSIINKDSDNRAAKVQKFVDDYKNNISGNIKIATFGEKVKALNSAAEISLKFDDRSTNFEKLLPFIKNEEDEIASITILSDGIITDGSNSTIEFEKLNIPIFTIAIGDSTKPSDVGIKKVEFNKIVYKKSETEINVVLSNSNFANKNVVVSLNDKSGVIKQKQIKLSSSGINNIKFNYTPENVGKNYLTVKVTQIEKEETYANNKYPFVIDVLNDKTNVLIIAGAPSPDLSIVSKSLAENKRVKLNKIIQITENNFLDTINFTRKIDSADIFILIDFPTPKTPPLLIKSVMNNLKVKNRSYFLFLSELCDFNQFQQYNNLFPFTIKNYSRNIFSAQPEVLSKGNGIISNSALWSNLPPIKIRQSNIEVKKGATILVTGKINNIQMKTPIIFIQKLASSRRMVFNGFNFWRWKLNADDALESLFISFLNNSIKWLSTKKEERIFVNTVKDIFNPNESVEFLANIYDETLTPINNASIEIEIYSGNYKEILKLNSTKNGLYKGKINISKSGNFIYKATVTLSNKELKVVTAKFIVSDIEIENINFVLNSNYLKFISNITSGMSFDINNYSELFPQIKQLIKVQRQGETILTHIELWRNNWILVIIILLLSLEWIIRKRKGML